MEISAFLNPVKEEVVENCNLRHKNQIGNTITIFKNEENFPELDGFQVALIGVEEDRYAVDNEGCKAAPDAIRHALYPLFNHWPELKICDLGNVKSGLRVEDTYYALSEVFLALMKRHIVPVFIGGSQDLTYPIYQVYENTGKLVNITAIDPRFDIGEEGESINSESYLSHIILNQPNYLFNYTNIGYQTYYIDNDNISLMKQLLFDVYRLGVIKNYPEQTEPLLRNADIITIDAAAFCAADVPGVKRSSPNGLSSEDGCKMARYAGLNTKLTSIGFFNYNPQYDINYQSANNLAEMIWYFLEGFSLRQNDTPTAENRDEFTKYIVRLENYDELIFLCHKTTGKWWMEIAEHFIPCSKSDYDMAMRNELPDRWWQFYQKLM